MPLDETQSKLFKRGMPIVEFGLHLVVASLTINVIDASLFYFSVLHEAIYV